MGGLSPDEQESGFPSGSGAQDRQENSGQDRPSAVVPYDVDVYGRAGANRHEAEKEERAYKLQRATVAFTVVTAAAACISLLFSGLSSGKRSDRPGNCDTTRGPQRRQTNCGSANSISGRGSNSGVKHRKSYPSDIFTIDQRHGIRRACRQRRKHQISSKLPIL